MFSKIFLLVKPLKHLFLSLSLFALIFVGVESLAESNLDSGGADSSGLTSASADSSAESALDKKAQKAQEKLEKKAQKEAQKQAQKDAKKANANALNPEPTEQDIQAMQAQEKQKQLYFLRAQYYQYLLQKAQEQENISKNGWFVGALLGTSQINSQTNVTTGADSTRTIDTSINPLAFGVMGGYLRFIGTAPIGVRAYGQYLGAFNFASGIEDSISTHLTSFNIDVVGDLPIAMEGYYIGAYVGVGAGVQTFSQRGAGAAVSGVSVGSVINCGLSVTLDFKHRLEAGLKVPPSVYNQSYSFGLMYLVGYQYLF
ncbi:hypothetical protein BKN38_04670 [Helicobacter sp. CLO-3]|uniref:outer membrane beta-barrel protein n=1 Tax=unclassified Helicobacter TaxID=2593540 RepID=UPI000805BFAB|nr:MULTISPECIES: outer membrane beta-barrel protein [unclassified Helicobacter]OBV29832.1 hypothetical protein BA723_04165 [Helicobacter sp. CLO-3]OHU83982.1 hypothetical protein BKN38_04670 [Helicobacter sp. CLO-3]